MSFDPNEIQALGARIQNADKDPFGLQTNGKGAVVVPAGSSFMKQVLALPQKHLILGDHDHETHEILFSPSTAKDMAAAGIKYAYLEHSAMELQFMLEAKNKNYLFCLQPRKR